ncbi:VOC family protein [Deinococcus koreensis]|uniref:Glyoxalase n=1 Tax=Deinococcus koreensis TaxID=2054903 RepID=A0A2K3UWQ2_9DEIO|nr:VOC family protein [Deinococcus koreensis]PNY80969.1 glyoxalase [Deinococcus koreensis]
MNWTLEVVVVPVSDIDRAKAFYEDGLGFKVDHDTRMGETRRIVQLTPPGSGCSVVIGTGLSRMAPGSMQGLQLVVRDVRAARDELLARGVQVGEIQVMGGPAPRPATPDEALNFVGFLTFQDPDGNGWAVQQIDARE